MIFYTSTWLYKKIEEHVLFLDVLGVRLHCFSINSYSVWGFSLCSFFFFTIDLETGRVSHSLDFTNCAL